MTKIETMLSVHAAMPSRHSVAILTAAVMGSRPSRSWTDAGTVGAVVQHPQGYGIIATTEKINRDGQWVILSEIVPPRTDAERDAIAHSMARSWDASMSAVALGDHARSAEYLRCAKILKDAGLRP